MGGDTSRKTASSLFSSSSSALASGTGIATGTGAISASGLGSTYFGSGSTRSRNFQGSSVSAQMYSQDDDMILEREKSGERTSWYTSRSSQDYSNSINGEEDISGGSSDGRRRRGSDAIAWLIAMVGFWHWRCLSTDGTGNANTVKYNTHVTTTTLFTVLFYSK